MVRQFLAGLCVSLLTVGCAREEPSAPVSQPEVRADVRLAPDFEVIEARVPANATLDGLLRQHDLPAALVEAAVASARSVFDPRALRADRRYRLVRTIDGLLREFEYEIDADRFLRLVSRSTSRPDLIDAEVLPFEKETGVTAIRATIDAEHPSLIAAMDAAGENVQLAMSLAEIFSGEIDFESDLQPGDSFELLFEKSTRDGQLAGYGPIMGARFVNEGKERQAFRWVDPATGKPGYYDVNGRSLKRVMLRSPLRFVPRVTSGFSRNRLHPVYRVYRAHLGVDYGAPHGSPVVAVASGVVVSAGWSGGGGRTIRIRHGKGLETYYLHLASFAKGIRAGARVEQGQVVGRVGASGTATGPHLDYRLKRNGVFVNPLVEHRKQPPGDPIPKAHLAAFMGARDGLLRQLSTVLLAEAPRRKPDAIKVGGGS